MMDEFVSPEVWICRAEGGRRLCRVTVGDQGLVPFAPEYRNRLLPAPAPIGFICSGQGLGEDFPTLETGRSADPNSEAKRSSRESPAAYTGSMTVHCRASPRLGEDIV